MVEHAIAPWAKAHVKNAVNPENDHGKQVVYKVPGDPSEKLGFLDHDGRVWPKLVFHTYVSLIAAYGLVACCMAGLQLA